MEPRNFSPEIHKIMERELAEMASFFIKEQCLKLGIMPDYITSHDIPKLSKALSEAMEDFGPDKSRRIVHALRQLIKSNQTMKTKAEE